MTTLNKISGYLIAASVLLFAGACTSGKAAETPAPQPQTTVVTQPQFKPASLSWDDEGTKRTVTNDVSGCTEVRVMLDFAKSIKTMLDDKGLSEYERISTWHKRNC